MTKIYLSIFVLSHLFLMIFGHGRLIEPPSRASMWRYGFDTPHDYNDNECYCGGFTRQWQRNNGKCGICGDAWDIKPPRAHETGGLYGNSIIVRKYKTNSVIPINIEITANHRGYFEFRLCPMNVRGKEVNQECLDRYVLEMVNGTQRYYPGLGNKVFESYYKLPADVVCAQCVLQWKYVAGNNWGDCGNGTGAVGCGPQEEFRGCADISIGDDYPPLSTTPPTIPASSGNDSNQVIDEITPDIKSHWYFNLIIVGICLISTLSALLVLYLYYYHAERAKKWLKARRTNSSTNDQHGNSAPIVPPRHKRLTPSNLHL